MTTGTARVAGAADVDRIVEILTGAFFHDPLWGPAFPDLERRAGQAAGLWRFYVTCVQRYPYTFLTAGGEATAVWIPPGGVELTHDEEADLERLLLATTGRETTDGILEIMGQFDAARPREPHYYLGCSAPTTSTAARGTGCVCSPKIWPRSTRRAWRPTSSRPTPPTTPGTGDWASPRTGRSSPRPATW